MGIYAKMCIWTHPLGELNTTLEIVFSTQNYWAITVASVWFFSNSHEEISRRNSRGRWGEQNHFSPAFHSSPFKRPEHYLLTSGRCLSLQLEKCYHSGLTSCFRLKHLVNPSIARQGAVLYMSVCLHPLSLSQSLFLPSLAHSLMSS